MRLHQERAGTGPALVLTHGLGDDSTTWDAVVGPLARRHTVIRWDLRGHGRSEAPAPAAAYTAAAALDDLLGVVAGLDAPVDLVGHSLGGYLSLRLALEHPEPVRTLTLVSSGPGFRSERARADWNRLIDRLATGMPIPPQAAGLGHHADGWVIEHLATLDRPLLQIVGGNDTRFHDGVAYVARMIPAATTEHVPGAGHHPQRSDPDAVVAAIDRHTTSPGGLAPRGSG